MKQVLPVAEDEQLRLLQLGDEQTLRLVYRQHYQTVVNMVLSNAGSLQEAKDIYQETVLIFIEKVRDEKFELTCSIKTFIYSVSRRLWLKQLQQKNRLPQGIMDTDEHVDVPMQEALDREEQYQMLNHALEAIGEPCRSILKDFYMHNQSMEEITEKFGYTNADNAKNQKYKCLKRLKKLFFDTSNHQGGQGNAEQI